MIYSIKNKNVFHIEEEYLRHNYDGCDQEWYLKRWQRMSGCGPCAMTNVMHYFNCRLAAKHIRYNLSRAEWLDRMQEMWEYVTPTIGGVYSTEMFRKGAVKYIGDKRLNIKIETLDIDKSKAKRPDPIEAMSFLIEGLKRDMPIAFLNLEHGTVEALESWHWVTIISMDYELHGTTAFVEILDGGRIKRIDILEWLLTTKLGGGFVRFEVI